MIVIGIVGWKNSGKTRLVQELIKYFVTKKLKVGTIKHAHHNFDIDKQDTDSFLHRKAGAKEVLISSSKRWAKIEEKNNFDELSLHDLINKIETSDIILVEGYKKENHKKIEVIRKIDPFHKPLFSHVKNIIAVVSNEKIDTDLPVFKDNDFNTIGEFILSQKI